MSEELVVDKMNITEVQHENTFYKIIAAADKLKKHKVEFNILTVLTGYCADHIDEIYKYFRSKGNRW